MNTLTIRLVTGLAVLLMAYFGTRYVLDLRAAAIANQQTAQQLSATATATSAISNSLNATTDEAAASEYAVATARGNFARQTRELENEDEAVRDWRAVRVPAGMRILACERRAARDRLAAAGAGSQRADDSARSCRLDQAP